MSFTFDPELGDNISKVRTLLGDTASPGKVSDEAIEWALESEGGVVIEAAAFCAENLAAHYSAQAQTRTVGELSISMGDLSLKYATLAADLRARRSRNGVPIGFGWDRGDKEATASDSNREPIISKKGGMDHPGVSEGA